MEAYLFFVFFVLFCLIEEGDKVRTGPILSRQWEKVQHDPDFLKASSKGHRITAVTCRH